MTGAVSGKHTAGEWRVAESEGGLRVFVQANPHNYGWHDVCEMSNRAMPTFKANGHLIAASPTMYAALQPAVLEEIADTLEGSGWARAPLLVVILRDQAKAQREALAKAEGRHDQL